MLSDPILSTSSANITSQFDDVIEIDVGNPLDISCNFLDLAQSKDCLSSNDNADSFSIFSHNVKSYHNKYSQLCELHSDFGSAFSVIALQEVWSVGRNLDIPGYQNLIYNTHAKNLTPLNPNCGGGVGIVIKNKLNFEILEFDRQFLPKIYESIWVKLI